MRDHTTTRMPSVRVPSRKSTSGSQKAPSRARLVEMADALERVALRREKVLALRDRALADRARGLADSLRRVASRIDTGAPTSAWIDEWKRLARESATMLDRGAGETPET